MALGEWLSVQSSRELYERQIAIGAIVPVAPFMIFTGPGAVYASLALSGLGLFLIGAGCWALPWGEINFYSYDFHTFIAYPEISE